MRTVSRSASLTLGIAVCLVAPVALTLRAQQPGVLQGEPSTPAAAAERAAALQAEADRLARESRTLLGELRRLEVERDLQIARSREANAAVAAATRVLEASNGRLIAIEAQRVAQAPDLKARLVDLYKRGRAGNVRLLLGTSSVRDFGRTMRAVASMARVTEQRLVAHRNLLVQAQAERDAQVAALQQLETESRRAAEGREAAARAVRERAALLADIDKRRDLTAQMAGELQMAARRLDEQVSSVAAAATSPPPAAAAAPAAPVITPRLPVRGGVEWPVEGRLVGRFGEAAARSNGGAARNGIEIEAPEGTPVQAVHAGTVVYASSFAGFGTLVIVDHGQGYHSVYGYLRSTTLKAGDVVDVGREVGRVGLPPGGTPALYFEFRIDGRSVDPVQWLRPR